MTLHFKSCANLTRWVSYVDEMYAPAQKMSSGISRLGDEIAIYFYLAIEKVCASAYITRHARRVTYNRTDRKTMETESAVGAERYPSGKVTSAKSGQHLRCPAERCRTI